MNNNERLRLLPPWSIYIKKMEALFDGDPQIACNVNWDGNNPSIVLATSNPDKAAALLKLLPEEKEFGDVVLKIGVDCKTISNNAFADPKELFETAFSGNPAFAYVVTTEGYWYVPFCYVVFAREIVQFFSDSLNDPHGVSTTLYQDIAAELFEKANLPGGVAYCTDTVAEMSFGVSVEKWLGDAVKH